MKNLTTLRAKADSHLQTETHQRAIITVLAGDMSRKRVKDTEILECLSLTTKIPNNFDGLR